MGGAYGNPLLCVKEKRGTGCWGLEDCGGRGRPSWYGVPWT